MVFKRKIAIEKAVTAAILVSFVIMLVFFLTLPPASYTALQYNNTDYITINVTVAPKIMVDINPSNLTWTNVYPGTAVDGSNETNGYDRIWIENTGSVNITEVWLANSADLPGPLGAGPFGTGNASLYDPANMVVISKNGTRYFFINRKEYPDSRRYTGTFYIKFDPGATWGRFRNSSYEYFWEIVNGTSGNCSDGTFRIGILPHTLQSTGTLDVSSTCTAQPLSTDLSTISITSTTCRTGQLTPIFLNVNNASTISIPDGVYGVAKVAIGQDNSTVYCVFVKDDCSFAIFAKWNADLIEAASAYCTGVNPYIVDPSNPLLPGGITDARVMLYVPYGVPYGELGSATERKIIVYAYGTA